MPDFITIPVSVAYGDGIGPDIMEETLRRMRQAGANIAIESIEIGQRFYENSVATGIPPYAWQTLERTRLLLKAPTLTPPDCISTTDALIQHFGTPRIIRRAFKAEALPTDNIPEIHVAASYVADGFAFFEPLHGITPQGKFSCPTPGMIEAAAMLLEHIGQPEVAEKLREI